ncbi:MAG: N-acetylglucosamine-6-phosphate deacetylase [Lachnospiraceae bacterium]|nr:N-acetylglucosamine-6-phosphate deacetylase [Lachnospiraceae bacterium]
MIIQSKRVWICGQFMPAQLEIVGEKIHAVHAYGEKTTDMDYGNRRILPGFLDVHTHGCYGFDTNDAEPEGLRRWMAQIPEEGVTSILPTTVTQMPDVLLKAVANVAKVVGDGYEGAEILGIHFEGPYLDMEYKGAQPPEAIAKPTVEQFQMYQEAAHGLIRYITMATEQDEDFTLTRYLKGQGVVVSMGHSAATYEQAMLGIANGATSMTHVYNGMTPYHHRKPGLVGTAMRVRDIYGEVICDGCHSHMAALNNFFTAKGRDYAIMITDSLRAKHCPPGGTYDLGGHPIEIRENGLAYLKGTDTIAGSTLSMNHGLKILIEDALVPVDAAINSCTINPARCLGVDDRKGKLTAGHDADIVVLEDNYEVLQTYCRGRAMLPEA